MSVQSGWQAADVAWKTWRPGLAWTSSIPAVEGNLYGADFLGTVRKFVKK